jgi:hypothetical protein
MHTLDQVSGRVACTRLTLTEESRLEVLTEEVRQELLLDAEREACLSALGSVVPGVGDTLVTCEGKEVPDLSQLLQQLEAQRKSLNLKP